MSLILQVNQRHTLCREFARAGLYDGDVLAATLHAPIILSGKRIVVCGQESSAMIHLCDAEWTAIETVDGRPKYTQRFISKPNQNLSVKWGIELAVMLPPQNCNTVYQVAALCHWDQSRQLAILRFIHFSEPYAFDGKNSLDSEGLSENVFLVGFGDQEMLFHSQPTAIPQASDELTPALVA